MRRIAPLLGTLAATGVMTLLPPAHSFAAPGRALAASGTLVLSGVKYTNPTGCYNSTLRPLSAANHTDESFLVFDAADCTGKPLGVVAPGKSRTFEFGASVYVP